MLVAGCLWDPLIDMIWIQSVVADWNPMNYKINIIKFIKK